MAFVSTCIEATARLLNTSYKEVYQRMKQVGLIERYIIPHYEALHTQPFFTAPFTLFLSTSHLAPVIIPDDPSRSSR